MQTNFDVLLLLLYMMIQIKHYGIRQFSDNLCTSFYGLSGSVVAARLLFRPSLIQGGIVVQKCTSQNIVDEQSKCEAIVQKIGSQRQQFFTRLLMRLLQQR